MHNLNIQKCNQLESSHFAVIDKEIAKKKTNKRNKIIQEKNVPADEQKETSI